MKNLYYCFCLLLAFFCLTSFANDNRDLFNIFRTGDIVAIDELIQIKGVDVNLLNSSMRTPLHTVVARGDIKLTKYLVDKGAELNITDIHNQTALLIAVKNRRESIVKYLVEKEAYINVPDVLGHSPLHKAMLRNYPEIAIFLIEQGAELDIPDKIGQTVLMIAVRKGSESIVKYLVEKEVDINAQDDGGYSPLHYAVSHEHLEIAIFLIHKGADVTLKNRMQQTVLTYAASSEDTQIFNLLVEKGADIKTRECYGTTILMNACRRQYNIETIKRLINGGVDINAINTLHETALLIAVESGNIQIIEYLVSNGADVNIRNVQNLTALGMAVLGGHIQIVEYLVSNGADFDIKNDAWHREVLRAAFNNFINKPDVMRVLLPFVEKIDGYFVKKSSLGTIESITLHQQIDTDHFYEYPVSKDLTTLKEQLEPHKNFLAKGAKYTILKSINKKSDGLDELKLLLPPVVIDFLKNGKPQTIKSCIILENIMHVVENTKTDTADTYL